MTSCDRSGEYSRPKVPKVVVNSTAEHERANDSYLDEGVMLLELATRAADLFERQSASEKRRLLDFVLSNSTWANGELTPVFRQPFDMIADMATACATEKAAGMATSDLCQAELPLLDTFRTFLRSPPLDFRLHFQAFQESFKAA